MQNWARIRRQKKRDFNHIQSFLIAQSFSCVACSSSLEIVVATGWWKLQTSSLFFLLRNGIGWCLASFIFNPHIHYINAAMMMTCFLSKNDVEEWRRKFIIFWLRNLVNHKKEFIIVKKGKFNQNSKFSVFFFISMISMRIEDEDSLLCQKITFFNTTWTFLESLPHPLPNLANLKLKSCSTQLWLNLSRQEKSNSQKKKKIFASSSM